LALLWLQHENAREGIRSAKMLARTLKMLGYFWNETTCTDIDTAAMISRAMKVVRVPIFQREESL